MSFRVGIVSAQDATNCRVRVKFPEREQMVSFWLPVLVRKSQNDKAYSLPDIGEQVVCLMDADDEDGCVLGAVYSSVDTPPAGMTKDKWHYSASDGAAFEYDRSAHALSISLPSSATATITANGATIEIDASGNILVNPASGALVKIAGGGPALARVGDPVWNGTSTIGTIQSGSTHAQCG